MRLIISEIHGFEKSMEVFQHTLLYHVDSEFRGIHQWITQVTLVKKLKVS